MKPTEGRAKPSPGYVPVVRTVERAPGASDGDAIHAFLTDAWRRAKADEIEFMSLLLKDRNGDIINYQL